MTSDDAAPGETNPAAELLGIFTQWRDSAGRSNATRRGLSDSGIWDGLERHVRAMDLIQDLIAAIDDLEADGRNVRPYRARLNDWASAVLALRTGSWTAATNAPDDFNDPMMAMLETLADTLAHRPGIAPQDALVVSALLDDVLAAASDTAIDERLATHIRHVVRVLQDCVDQYALNGAAASLEAWNAVWVATQAAAHQTTGEQRTRWENLRDHFLIPTSVGIGSSLPALVAQIAAN